MSTHVALLRAVNVGGKGLVKMTDVRAAFESAGCRNVRTFQAAGNVLFDVPGARNGALPASMKTRIRAGMQHLLGGEPGICYRALDEVDAIVAADPFGALANDTMVKLYVVFMDRRPARVPPLPLSFPEEAIEITHVRATEAFVVSHRKRNGLMYGFPNACVESLGVRATSRNWNTVIKLVEFAKR
jgi:uncharacterized protein (DUF1697 family)